MCIPVNLPWQIRQADCPDRLCVHMGKIGLNGQSLVCLPHEVVVEIQDGANSSPSEGVDIVVE